MTFEYGEKKRELGEVFWENYREYDVQKELVVVQPINTVVEHVI